MVSSESDDSRFFGSKNRLLASFLRGTIYNNDALTHVVGLSNLTNVSGRLSIEYNDALINVDALSNLTDIQGTVYINQNDGLTNIDGLSGIANVAGSLTIARNDVLRNINDGFTNLVDVQGSLAIESNDALRTISGFSSLHNLGGTLSISWNNALTNINGFSSLNILNGRFEISNNSALQYIDGFSSLNRLDGYLVIDWNFALTTIDAFTNLTEITGTLKIHLSRSLIDIDALANLTILSGTLIIDASGISNVNALTNLRDIQGTLVIDSNSRLTDINALSNLTDVTGTIIIKQNNTLTDINALTNLTDVLGTLSIISNGQLRNIDGLANLSNIQGTLTISTNNALTNINALSNLTDIQGSLSISYNYGLTNINALSNLTDIQGSLYISNNIALPSIDPLSNLTNIQGLLSIEGNSALTNIDGLSNLTDIFGTLNINRNALTNIDPLSNLTNIQGTLNIAYNYALANINGLASLTYLPGALTIRRNDALRNIDGLSNITSMQGTLTISWNDALRNINGLSNLMDIEGRLIIEHNNRLRNIDGFANLNNLSGRLEIEYNEDLTNINGFSNLTSLNGALIISNNDVLTNISEFLNLNSFNGTISVSNNNSLTRIDALANLNSFNGTLGIYWNEALTNINGLTNLTDLPGILTITYNNALTNIDGLSNLTNIIGELNIDQNHGLTNIDALASLTDVQGALSITSNSTLADCCGIRHLLPHSHISISRNLSPCDSQAEIIDKCAFIKAFIEPACVGLDNGVLNIIVRNYDASPFTYAWHRLEDGASDTGTSTDAYFTIYGLSPGTYSIEVSTPTPETYVRHDIILGEVMGNFFEVLRVQTTNSLGGTPTGEINLSLSGGLPPYNIVWTGPTNGMQNNVTLREFRIGNILSGEYQIQITDANNESRDLIVSVQDDDTPVSSCASPMDIVILNLVSSAINAEEYKESQQYFIDFLSSINIGTSPDDSRAGIIEWAGPNDQDIKIPMTGNLAVLSTYDEETRSYDGATNIISALLYARQYLYDLGQPERQKVILFTLDGCPGFSASALCQELKDEGIIIGNVGIDYIFRSARYQSLMTAAASTDDLARFAQGFGTADPLLLGQYLQFYACPRTRSTAYFERDGQLTIDQIDLLDNCPTPIEVDVTFTIAALEQLAIPGGSQVTFYHNNPALFGATPISTFTIPCDIESGSEETFTIQLPIETATHLYAVFNDNGLQPPAFLLPITDLEESVYHNNIDDQQICVDNIPTLQAFKYSSTPLPICDHLVIYNIDVCNISEQDAIDVTITDQVPGDFVLTESRVNTNGCSTDRGSIYDIPAGCCVSLTLTYDVSGSAQGNYMDQGVVLSGPPNQEYIDFIGENTTAEDVVINGTIDCNPSVVSITKDVNAPVTCPDHTVTYTFTIRHESGTTPATGITFTDVLPEGMEWIYRPYDVQNVSLSDNPILEGQTARFVIDQLEPGTEASFSIDAIAGTVVADLIIQNEASLSGLQAMFNAGQSTITSNRVTTTILADRQINIPDTVYVNASETQVDLTAIVSGIGDVLWSTTGDGFYTDTAALNTTYIYGESDRLDSVISVFIEISTACGNKGRALTIVRRCDLDLDDLNTYVPCPGDADDDQVIVEWSGGQGPYALEGGVQFDEITTPYSISGLASGSHTFLIRDAIGCALPFDVQIEATQPIVVTPNILQQATCGLDNGEVSLQIEGNGPFEISGDVLLTNVISPVLISDLTPGEYNMEIIDVNGCTQEARFDVLKIEQAIPETVVIDPMCEEVFGSITINWSGGSAPFQLVGDLQGVDVQSGVQFDELSVGSYDVVLVDAAGCESEIQFIIEREDQLSAQYELDRPTCQEENGSITLSISGVGPFEVTGDLSRSDVAAEALFTPLSEGTYNIVITDQLGCSIEETIELIPTDIAEIAVSVDPSECDATTGRCVISWTGGIPPYQLSGDLQENNAISGAEFTDLEPGLYQIELTDSLLCTTRADFEIILRQHINTFDTIVACGVDQIEVLGQIFTADGDISESFMSAAECDSTANYHIDFVDEIMTSESFTICPGDSLYVHGAWISDPGVYEKLYTSEHGCDSIDQVIADIVHTPPSPEVNVHCDDFEIELTITPDTEWQPQWSNGDMGYSTTYSGQTSEAQLTLRAQPNCVEQMIISLPILPNRSSIPSIPDTTVEEGSRLHIALGLDEDEWDIKWSPSSAFNCDNCSSVWMTPQVEVEVSVLLEHLSGCVYESLFRVDVIRDVYVPNTFTPNGDQINDIWTIYSEQAVEVKECIIFNRWGDEIYRSYNGIVAWDGTTQNTQTPVAPGVYIYSFKYIDATGQQHTRSGDVTVLR